MCGHCLWISAKKNKNKKALPFKIKAVLVFLFYHTPLLTDNTAVEVVSSTKFLGVQVTLLQSLHTGALVKRAQQ